MIKNMEFLQKIFENLNDGVIVLGKDFRVQFINPQASAVTGFTPEEARTRLCSELFGSKRCGELCPIKAVKNGEQNNGHVMRFQNKYRQEKYILTKAIHIQGHWIEIFKDITSEVEFEKGLWGGNSS